MIIQTRVSDEQSQSYFTSFDLNKLLSQHHVVTRLFSLHLKHTPWNKPLHSTLKTMPNKKRKSEGPEMVDTTSAPPTTAKKAKTTGMIFLVLIHISFYGDDGGCGTLIVISRYA